MWPDTGSDKKYFPYWYELMRRFVISSKLSKVYTLKQTAKE